MNNPESEPFRLATSASHLLHRAEQLAADRFTQLVGDTITLRQFAVLAAIAEEPGVSQSELVRATGIDRSTLADMMLRLVNREWVVRTSSPLDARAYSLKLSDEGLKTLNSTAHHARAADAAILDLLPRTKRRSILSTLTKIARLAEQAAEKAEREAKRKAKREARKLRQKTKARAKTERASTKPSKKPKDAATPGRKHRV